MNAIARWLEQAQKRQGCGQYRRANHRLTGMGEYLSEKCCHSLVTLVT